MEQLNFEDQPDSALRTLLLRSVAEAKDGNERYQRLTRPMASDAITFAQTMLDSGARTDSIDYSIVVKPGNLLLREICEARQVRVWAIRERDNYSGERLWSGGSWRYSIGINTGGGLVLFNRDLSRPPKAVTPGSLFSRISTDTPEGAESIYQSWLDDLQSAATEYTKEPRS